MSTWVPTDSEVSVAEFQLNYQTTYEDAYNSFELAKRNGNNQLAFELKEKMFVMEREHIRELEHRLAEALSGDDKELKLLLTHSLTSFWERDPAASLPSQPILLRFLARGNREPTLDDEKLAFALQERYRELQERYRELQERYRELQERTQELAAMYASTREEVESHREQLMLFDAKDKKYDANFIKIRKRLEQIILMLGKLSDVIVRCGGKRVPPPTVLENELMDKFILDITDECDRLGLPMAESQEAEEESDDLSLESDVVEEKTNAKEAFDKVSNGASSIPASDFGKVIESLGTTYCEKEHRRTIKKISTEESGDLIVSKESFVAWYIEWLFGDEESSYSD